MSIFFNCPKEAINISYFNEPSNKGKYHLGQIVKEISSYISSFTHSFKNILENVFNHVKQKKDLFGEKDLREQNGNNPDN